MWVQHQNSSVLTLHLSINWFPFELQDNSVWCSNIYHIFFQLSLLAMENKILVAKLQQANQDSVVTDHSNAVETKEIASKQDFTTATATTCAREIQVDETKLSAAGPEVILDDLLLIFLTF